MTPFPIPLTTPPDTRIYLVIAACVVFLVLPGREGEREKGGEGATTGMNTSINKFSHSHHVRWGGFIIIII